MYRGHKSRAEYLLALLKNGDNSDVENLSSDEEFEEGPQQNYLSEGVEDEFLELLNENNIPTEILQKIAEVAGNEDNDPENEDDNPECEDLVRDEIDCDNSSNTNNNVESQVEDIDIVELEFVTKKANIKWTKNRQVFTQSKNDFQLVASNASDILTPLNYFLKYIPITMFEQIAHFTNMYALQQNGKNFKICNAAEIKILCALHIAAGTLKFPRSRMYWEKALGIDLFTENMSRDRFFQLRSNIHFVDNLA